MNKKGIFLPLVLIVLLFLAIVGYVFNRMAQNEFRNAYYTSDMLRAQFVAESIINEAMYKIRAKQNNELRDKFITESDFDDIDFEFIDKLKDDMETTEDDATTNRADFDYEFSARTVNINQFNDCDDIMGTLVLEVSVELNNVNRTIVKTFDYKVVDVRPAGNKYTFMTHQNGNEAFNRGGEFFVDASDSDGISIGSNAVVNLHAPYDNYNEYMSGNFYDLKKDNKNSDQSLIPGGSKQNHVASADSVKNNEPFENQKQGQVGNASNVHGGYDKDSDFEEKDDCSPIKMFRPNDPDNYPFNCGYVGGQSKTHFFHEYCQAPTTIFGQVKKRYTTKEYKFTNIPHMRGPDQCDTAKAAEAAAKPADIVAPGTSQAAKMTAYLTCGCSNPTDWTDDDGWEVVVMKQDVQKDYKTSESTMGGGAIQFNPDINFKGNFDKYKEACSRFIEEFPGPQKDTFIASGKLYLEGLVACNSATLRDITNYMTPGGIISQNQMDVSGNISPHDNLSYSDGDFFKQKSVLSLLSMNSLKNDSSQKKRVGFLAMQKFESSGMNIEGNLLIGNLPSKNFGGELKYEPTLKSGDFLLDDDKSYVVTISPIPSAFIIKNNTK